jgi:hypothetical protein
MRWYEPTHQDERARYRNVMDAHAAISEYNAAAALEAAQDARGVSHYTLTEQWDELIGHLEWAVEQQQRLDLEYCDELLNRLNELEEDAYNNQ